MKDMLFRRMARGCFLLVTFLFLLPGCKQSDSWEEPVAEYFDKYTNTAAIEKHEISCGYEKDAGGTSCISSYGNKTVSFYLRNPRKYNLRTSFSTLGDEITVSQSTSDKSVIYVTYPESYLIENDCGGSIGGTISLQEEETLREFESYTFSLKCNTPPPSVKGPMVNAAEGKYIVCFYMPTTELGSQRHSASSHKLFINNALVREGSPSDLMAASASRPPNLEALQGGSLFSATTPAGCTAFYYETGVNVQGGILSWSIRIEDGEGLSSKTMKASSDVRDVNLTLTGGEVFAQGDASQTFTASTDEGEVVAWSWVSSDESVVTVSGTNNGNSTSGTVNIVGGGIATVTVQAELSDGRILTRQKEVRVLGISFNETQRDFLKGQSDVSLSVDIPGFPDSQTYTWSSNNTSVASVNSSGGLSLNAKGKATITVSATYGGKTVTKAKEIVVHEVKLTGGDFAFTGAGNYTTLTRSVESPSGESSPSGITYPSCISNLGSATFQSGSNYKFTSTSTGTATVTLTASLNGKTTTVTKQVKVYSVSINDINPLFSKDAGAKTLSATITPTPPSGYFTYSWTSGAPSKADFSGSTTGLSVSVTPKAAGKVQIAFHVKKDGAEVGNAYQDIYVISVTGLKTFLVGDADRALTVAPTSDLTYTWRSNTPSTARVYESNGKIIPVASGECTITCRAKLDSTYIDIPIDIKVASITLGGLADESAGITIAVGERFSYTWQVPAAFGNGTGMIEYISDSDLADVRITSNASSKYLNVVGKNVGTGYVGIELSKDGGSAFKKVKLTVVQAHDVEFSSLNTYLASLPANDKDHPYRLNVKNLTEDNLKQNEDNHEVRSDTLRAVLKASTKYVDLSKTTLPTSLTSMDKVFEGCSYLVKSPTIPTSVATMKYCFGGCTNLKEAPTLPSGVTDLSNCFQNCSNITEAPTLPNSVTNLSFCFDGCSKLATPPTIPNTVKNMTRTFSSCTSLTSAPTIPDSVNAINFCFCNCTSLTGTVTVNTIITYTPPPTNQDTWVSTFYNCTGITSVIVKSEAVKDRILSTNTPDGSNDSDNSAVYSKIVVVP